MKAKIEVVEIEKALQWGWISHDLIRPAFQWVYRVTSATNPDNRLTGACSGTREEIKKKAKIMAEKINEDMKGVNPFARPIKNNRGTTQETGFNKYPEA